MSNITELEAKYQELGKEIEKLKAKECEYPKFFRRRTNNGYIVKFTGLEEGEEVYSPTRGHIGFTSNTWAAHTNTDLWEEIPYDKETGFYHKQLVWCWDDRTTHERALRVYDAINNSIFSFRGEAGGTTYDNYEAYDWSCDYPNKWAIEAVKTLKD